MPPTDHLVEFLIASTLIILVPGPSVLFTVARAIAWGRFVAVMTVVGNALGMLVMSALIAFGFGPLLERSPLLYALVQWAGGMYLVWLGIDAIRHREVHAASMVEQGPVAPSGSKTLREGFVVGILNPKSLVFFAAVFPQFVDPNAGNVSLQLMVLGVIFATIAVLSDGTWGVVAGSAREWLAGNPRALVQMRVVGGCVMLILGALVLITAPRP
jgi:threonine/homoserine/homoserine lactone efflux protein